MRDVQVQDQLEDAEDCRLQHAYEGKKMECFRSHGPRKKLSAGCGKQDQICRYNTSQLSDDCNDLTTEASHVRNTQQFVSGARDKCFDIVQKKYIDIDDSVGALSPEFEVSHIMCQEVDVMNCYSFHQDLHSLRFRSPLVEVEWTRSVETIRGRKQ